MRADTTCRRPASIALAISTVFAVLLYASPPAVEAGTIGFRITSTVETGEEVTLTLELNHTGDETARDVMPTAVFNGREIRGERLPAMRPKTKHTWTIGLQDSPMAAGAYVVVVRVGYEDSNAYPFQVLAATAFDVEHRRRRPVTGSVAVPKLAPKASADAAVILNVPKDRGTKYRVHIVAPKALRVNKVDHEVSAGPDRRIRVPIRVRNTGLLAGTTANVYALVTGTDEDGPQTDLVRGTVRIVAPERVITRGTFVNLLIALVVILVVLELGSAVMGRRDDEPVLAWALPVVEAVLVCATSAFLAYNYPWDALLARTTVAGGDMGSLYYPTKLLAEEMLPSGQLTGWTMGNYAGFPILHFYSTLPFAVIALLGKVFPMQPTFKIVSLLGPTLLPLAAGYLFRAIGYSRGASVIASISVLPFLFQQGNSMWGGNIPSVLAGEYCHAIGLTLSLVFLGVLHRAVQGQGSWPLAAALLAAIGLSHTFSFFAAVWYSLFFVWPRAESSKLARRVLAVYAVAFLLLCFWGLPLPSRLIYTSEWSMIWRIKDWKEVLPEPLWPAAILSLANVIAMIVRVKSFRVAREGMLLFMIGGGALLYFVVPAVGFPDIRFVPVGQLFICLLAADFMYWLGSVLRFRLVYAACILAAGLAWGQSHLGYIPSWLKWNYSGYEAKVTWNLFEKINDHVRGDVNDPRVVYEHSQAHNRFGTSRAFENLPLFSGRSTLEGVFHQASQNSPFIFYLQSEISERGSGPFPQYTYTRLNPDAALPHLAMYNVTDIVAVSDAARKAYAEHPAYEKTFSSGTYAVFHVAQGETGYVVPAANEPVLYEGPEWKLALYRWYKHPELLDIPIVPADMIDEASRRRFELRTETIRRVPRQPLEGECEVESTLEQYRIVFETNCPERPHIVKVSYFPRWKAVDGSRVHLVSPGFMLVYPQGERVELVYGRNFIDWFGLALSLGGLILLVACWLRPATANAFEDLVSRPAMPMLRFFEHHRLLLSIVLLGAAMSLGAATRITLRAPEKEYKAMQDAYRARDFDVAIPLLEQWVAVDRDTFKQATALYQLGVSYSDQKNHAAAIQTHERLRFEFPNVNYGAGTVFHLARNYALLGELGRAREYADILDSDHPETNWSKRLRREHPQIFAEPVGGSGN